MAFAAGPGLGPNLKPSLSPSALGEGSSNMGAPLADAGPSSSSDDAAKLSLLDRLVLTGLLFLVKHGWVKMPERLADGVPAELAFASDPVRRAIQKRVGSAAKFSAFVVDAKWNAVSWALAGLAVVAACALVLIFIFGEGLSDTVNAVRAMRPDVECRTSKCGYPAIFSGFTPLVTQTSEHGDPGGCECVHPTTFGQQCNASAFHTAQYMPYAPEALMPCPLLNVGAEAAAIAHAPDRSPSAQLQHELKTMWKRPGPQSCRLETKEAWANLNTLDGSRTCLFHAEFDAGTIVPDFCPYNYRLFVLNDEILNDLPMLVHYAVIAFTESYKGGHVPQFTPRLDRRDKNPLLSSKGDYCEGLYTTVSCFFDSPSKCGSDGSDDLNEKALAVPPHGKLGAGAGSWTISEKDLPAKYKGRGLFWWNAQMANFFWRLNDKTMDIVEAMRAAIGMQGPMIAMHVAFSADCENNAKYWAEQKAQEEGKLWAGGSTECLPFARYMDLARLMTKRYDVRKIFLVTDNHDVLRLTTDEYSKEFEFTYGGAIPADRAFAKNFFQRARKIPGLANFDLENRGLTQVIRLELMSRCHYFIGALSNPSSRLAYQLMVGKKGFYPPFLSVDGEPLANGMFDKSVHTEEMQRSRDAIVKRAQQQANMYKALKYYKPKTRG